MFYEIIINRLFFLVNVNLGYIMFLENEKFKKKCVNRDKLIENDVIGWMLCFLVNCD